MDRSHSNFQRNEPIFAVTCHWGGSEINSKKYLTVKLSHVIYYLFINACPVATQSSCERGKLE